MALVLRLPYRPRRRDSGGRAHDARGSRAQSSELTWSMMIPAPQDLLPKAQGRLGRILVVDDEEALVRVTSRMLTSIGYEVPTAADGMRAVDLLASTTF